MNVKANILYCGVIETVEHFLLYCHRFSPNRNELCHNLHELNMNFNVLSPPSQIHLLLTLHLPHTPIKNGIAKKCILFVKSIYKLRMRDQ